MVSAWPLRPGPGRESGTRLWCNASIWTSKDSKGVGRQESQKTEVRAGVQDHLARLHIRIHVAVGGAGFRAHTCAMRGITARTVSSAVRRTISARVCSSCSAFINPASTNAGPASATDSSRKRLVLAACQGRLIEGGLRRREAGGVNHLKQAAGEGVIHPPCRAQPALQVSKRARVPTVARCLPRSRSPSSHTSIPFGLSRAPLASRRLVPARGGGAAGKRQ